MVTPTSPSSEARSQNPNPTARKPAYVFHEPFVSPEFGARVQTRSSRFDSGVDRSERRGRPHGASHGNESTNYPLRNEVPLPQAAPLYTVSAADATRGLLVTPATAVSDTLLLGKGPPIAGPTSTLKAAGGVKEKNFEPNSHEIPLPYEAVDEAEAEITPQPPLRPPGDMSPLVAEAICTWGEELRTILGQDLPDSGKPRMRMSMGRPMLTTTGLLPQIMTLRFSSPVRLRSIHLRASSVLRLVVDANEGLLGWKHGKTVTVPVESSYQETLGRDIVVDVRDMPSFKNTRSISVAITASRRTFCSVHQIYALGVQV